MAPEKTSRPAPRPKTGTEAPPMVRRPTGPAEPQTDGEQEKSQHQRGSHDQRTTLGRILKARRILQGWEQEALAARLERSQEWLSRVERGDLVLSVFEFARIADLLSLPFDAVPSVAWLGYEHLQPKSDADRVAPTKPKRVRKARRTAD